MKRPAEVEAVAEKHNGSADPGRGRHAVALLVILLAVAVAWLPSLRVPFLYDDLPEIIRNKALADPGDWRTIVRYNPARALLMLTFAADLRLWGLNTLPYHLENLFIHLLNAFLIYRIGDRLLRRPAGTTAPAAAQDGPQPRSGLSAPASWAPALAIALVFAVHPLFVEAVTYIASRSSSLAAFFYLSAFAAYIRFRDVQLERGRGAWVWLGLALNLYLLSIFTKEEGISLPAALLAYDLLFGARARTSAALERGQTGIAGEEISRPGVGWWTASAPFWVLCIFVAGARLWAYGTLEQTVIARSLSANLWTEIEVLAVYLRLLVAPYGLTLYHDYLVVTDPMRAVTLAALGLHIALLVVAVMSWRRRPLVSFGILWFYATLSPTSSFVPLKETMAEHRMYLAGIGPLLILGGALRGLRERWRIPPLVPGLALALPLAVMTFQVNTLWQDEIALWTRALELAPHSGDAAYTLGDAYRRKGALDQAENAYERSIRNYEALKIDLGPQKYNYVDALNNLGMVYAQRGNLDVAITYFRRALNINQNYTQGLNNLGYAQMKKGLYLESSGSFEETLKIDPDNWLAHYHLGDLYYKWLRDPEKASQHYKRALELNPAFPGADMVKARVLELGF